MCIRDRFHVRVKDRLPFTLSLLFLPDGGGVVGTGLVLPIVCAFDRHLVGCDNCVRSIGRDFVVADRERFHVPFLHVRQFFLQVGHAFGVDSHQIWGHDLLEVVNLFVFKRLPGCLLFFLHHVLSGRGGRQSNRSKQGHHCVADIFFHCVLSLSWMQIIWCILADRQGQSAPRVQIYQRALVKACLLYTS